MSATTDSLRSVPLFAELSDTDLKQLAQSMHEKGYSDGQEVVTEGESGLGFFVILEGSANVSVGGGEARSLGPGDHFGEMALLDMGGRRSASITAGEGLRCAGMTAWNFKPFVKDHPEIAWALLKTLAQRLRAAEARG
jgi:CRP/FNR family transcriptional regulator, cyclic AMP receptor protein